MNGTLQDSPCNVVFFHDARARRVLFTPTGLAWLQGFRDAVTQAEAEFRAEVGDDVATVVAIGLEAYAGGGD